MTLKTSIFSFLLFITSVVNAQNKDGAAILEQVKEKFYAVKEYEANVKIKVDVDFVKIPVKQGVIWFMQPDQVKVKIPGFALLPKRGMNFTPNQLLTGNYTAIYIKDEKLGEYNTYVIKVIPGNENDDIILSTIWVDQHRMVIRKLETTTKSEGTISMMFKFGSVIKKYDLPEEIVFSFDLRKNELPIGLTGDFENSEPRDKKSKNTKGSVTINYLEYFVNQGRANSVFKQAK